MRTWSAVIGVFAVVVISSQSASMAQSPAPGAGCERLTALRMANVEITSAQLVGAGKLTLPGNGNNADAASLPDLYRAEAKLTPSPDSNIRIEVWMPANGWNGKFLAVGNGGFAGSINYTGVGRIVPNGLITAVRAGYATASTDGGHSSADGDAWAVGHPEKVTDFGSRAVHEMTVTAKRLVASYYGRNAIVSYWNSCSSGGRQGMSEAQRFPEDYDGIIAGSPSLDWTGRVGAALRVAKVLEADEAARLPQPQRQLLHRAVVEACDVADGVKDGVLENPAACTFDPAVLECRGADGAGCLSAAQVKTARMIYAPAINPASNREITGLARGSELGWTDLGWTGGARNYALSHFRYLVFGDPAWTLQQFNFDSDIVRAEALGASNVNTLNPNLRPFFARGGKLIQYHGWSDPQISPSNSIQYYGRVLAALGGQANVQGSYRLFMVPGMGHCGGGEGTDSFDMVGALEQWVEQGRAPDRVVASHVTNNVVDRTRPLCPYPQVASHTGSGSTDEAANFVCRVR